MKDAAQPPDTNDDHDPAELVTVLTGFAIVAAVALVVIFVTKRA